MMYRVSLAVAVSIVAIAVTLGERPTSIMTYVLGAGISLVLMLVHGWPSHWSVTKVEQKLDRAGGRSELSVALSGERR